MKKIVLSIIAISLFSMFFVFAGGANEARLYYLPRNVADSNSVGIELTEQKAYTANDIEATFSNNTDKNLAIFRMRDSLKDAVSITISSNNGWQFVHENNPTAKRDFGMNAIIVEHKNVSRNYDTSVSKQVIGTSTTLQYSTKTATFVQNGSGASRTYTLTIPGTGYTQNWLSLYADYIREADFCVTIPNNNNDLEAGWYETEITVTTTSYQEYRSTESWSPKLEKDGGTKTFTQTIRIRGYVGVDPGEAGAAYSFTVNSAADTYTMDLGVTANPNPLYCVANIGFNYTTIVNSSPASTQKDKFVIYISATPDYTQAGTYQFIKMNTENQARIFDNTVKYTICLKPSSSFKTLDECTSITSYSGDTVLSKVGKYSDSVNSYKLTPTYASDQISESGALGGANQWKEEWHLSVPVYLKINSDSLTTTGINGQKHESGLYYSYLYVTLVSN